MVAYGAGEEWARVLSLVTKPTIVLLVIVTGLSQSSSFRNASPLVSHAIPNAIKAVVSNQNTADSQTDDERWESSKLQ
jgi:hypothetical protein